MPVKKILVAFDGSKHSRKALEWALNSYEAGTASIEVVTVVEPIANYSIPEAFPLEVTAFHQDQQAMREEKLKELRQEWAACGKEFTTHVLNGNIVETLLDYSMESKADLLVTGTRGAGGFKGLLLGSVAHELVTHAKMPVVVVK
ncbi:universal stress protein [uncultured Anaeromusa sp.]|uniref:universal stress protein n=1 Tax=uncultured Anaeromusa sp. TaxID=673273 RepID=UPI0029C8C917|nr:universal stress protein [uncultured Anaeromusa sp.]